MVAGLIVACFRQRAESRDGRTLRSDDMLPLAHQLIRLLHDLARALDDQLFQVGIPVK